MASTFVHIGDVHAAPGPRSADRWRAVDQILTEGLQLPRLGAWLLPGDLFDALSTTEDRNAWDDRLRRMADVAPVVMVYGNHDRKGDLDGFANLKATHPIYVIDRPHVLALRLATQEMAAIFCLPYPHKQGLVAAGIVPGDVVETAGDLLEPIFMLAAQQLADARAAGYLTLMIGHVNVAGAIASTGQPNVGHEIELNPRHLDRLGAIPKLLNHIHKPQAIAGAHYAGSVCRLDYGEIEEKRYLVATYDEDVIDLEPGDRWTITSHPIDVVPMFHIDGVLDRAGFHFEHDEWMCQTCFGTGDDASAPEGVCGTCTGHGRRSWVGCDVRVRYTYQASEKAVISEDVVRDLFVGALRLKVEGVAIPDRELRAPAVALAKTLSAKLAAYMKVDDLPPSIAQKLFLLEHDRAGIPSRVAEQIATLEARERATVAA